MLTGLLLVVPWTGLGFERGSEEGVSVKTKDPSSAGDSFLSCCLSVLHSFSLFCFSSLIYFLWRFCLSLSRQLSLAILCRGSSPSSSPLLF